LVQALLKGRKASFWWSFQPCFTTSANEFYIFRQCIYIVFILQCRKVQLKSWKTKRIPHPQLTYHVGFHASNLLEKCIVIVHTIDIIEIDFVSVSTILYWFLIIIHTIDIEINLAPLFMISILYIGAVWYFLNKP
jgi:hypothetical protein